MIKFIYCSYCKNKYGMKNKCIYLCKAFPDGAPIGFEGDVKNCNNGIHFEKKDEASVPFLKEDR